MREEAAGLLLLVVLAVALCVSSFPRQDYCAEIEDSFQDCVIRSLKVQIISGHFVSDVDLPIEWKL